MVAGVVLQRGGVLQQHGRGVHRRVPYLAVTRVQTQVAVVGAGAAGLYTALCAARLETEVTIVSAAPLAGSSSYWAQG
ncbi:MAG: FAD-binding protein, partial [Solirubrobacteraceae bacterium]